ncbi:hypothetical protein SLV14_006928 [Streptomyces sp. Je 1-4]|uniref:hypothetical protein n=1 Tax=Streptomyces TaxID=1883 RepID=UPI0021D85960|nr:MULTISPECIES: hypothetical protein [unclassified Streptomyces]UYB43893.1 hypothetical protein SLV14_006928 [Streptomyces sp. Je 1-4]UZQ40314.1 hypothetical protein SLV14N_006928 [Streptomyces sp. Je 1-4] [Streptomyces sp. Je 1-4 4N24]UZQ47731.1 hypothetical protein SLV14NA_006928 [Streptomyces sp. Je 1-4] [Streptomyces sp. Je 1-4 4N24_ara]
MEFSPQGNYQATGQELIAGMNSRQDSKDFAQRIGVVLNFTYSVLPLGEGRAKKCTRIAHIGRQFDGR